MFTKILIANRGEIVCRIIRTAKRLGIATVAIYSDADAEALHVQMADEAYRIGPAPSRDSYLNANTIIRFARESGAQAIHPGYGFLAENAAFAQSCLDAGLVFIGPTPAAIQAMGSKSTAKNLMAQAGIPLLPGYQGEAQDAEILLQAAEQIGYPVLLKPAAGGGGKGMRTVWKTDAFHEALISAKREALSSFGDDTLLIEKYLTKPRHVEVQIFGDNQGNIIHLFERDCSIQRRHQKIIEEAPAPALPETTRKQMGLTAIAAARAIHYVGAGTVEFLLDENGKFYFMEMNTRLQVEHPITEMITQQDLVEWQLRVAAGEPLPLVQTDITTQGHAFEARIYAEDPNRDFLPAIGHLKYIKTPIEDAHVRIDTGVMPGAEISPYYDPMIAKLIVWERNRDTALRRLQQALHEYLLVGVTTNVSFLAALASHAAFAAEAIDTHFIDEHKEDLFQPPALVSDQVLVLASLYVLLQQQHPGKPRMTMSYDQYSPWNQNDGWRLNLDNWQTLCFMDNGVVRVVQARRLDDAYCLKLPDSQFSVKGNLKVSVEQKCMHATLQEQQELPTKMLEQHELHAELQHELPEFIAQHVDINVIQDGNDLYFLGPDGHQKLKLHNPMEGHEHANEISGRLNAPMPGTVIAVMIQAGDVVNRGDKLIVLEAMKMEHAIQAPADGKVKAINFKVGDRVDEGAELLSFEEE